MQRRNIRPHRKLKPHHAFSTAGIVAISIIAVGLLGVSAFYSRTLLVSPQMAAVISAVLVDLTNEDRAKESLGELTVNPTLVAAAQAKANDMALKGYFAHTSPDGRSSWSWFRDQGYAFAYAGENLAIDFSDSKDVERAWMKSPTHRANIMNGKFTEIGIATAVGTYQGKKTTFVVQMFGTPSSVAAAPVRTAVEPSDPEDIAIASTEDDDVLGAAAEDEPKVAVTAPPEPAPETNPVVESSYEAGSEAPLWAKTASAPKTLLRNIYLVSALILLIALILTTGFEFRRHHFRHVAAAGFLIVLMGGLFFAADRFFFAETVITDSAAAETSS